MESFGDRLQKLLKVLYMSQLEFSKTTGLGRSSISEYITGRIVPTIAVIEKISITTKANPTWLVLGEGDMFLTKEKEILTIPPKDRPKEQIKKWLDDFWSHANPDERAWLKIEMKKKFPEFAEWLKRMDRSQEENKESLGNTI